MYRRHVFFKKNQFSSSPPPSLVVCQACVLRISDGFCHSPHGSLFPAGCLLPPSASDPSPASAWTRVSLTKTHMDPQYCCGFPLAGGGVGFKSGWVGFKSGWGGLQEWVGWAAVAPCASGVCRGTFRPRLKISRSFCRFLGGSGGVSTPPGGFCAYDCFGVSGKHAWEGGWAWA